jgi:hypothetical protein
MVSVLHWSDVLILVLIVALWIVGFAIALRSGVTSLHSREGFRRFAVNLSEALLYLVGYGTCLFALNRLVGWELLWAW